MWFFKVSPSARLCNHLLLVVGRSVFLGMVFEAMVLWRGVAGLVPAQAELTCYREGRKHAAYTLLLLIEHNSIHIFLDSSCPVLHAALSRERPGVAADRHARAALNMKSFTILFNSAW